MAIFKQFDTDDSGYITTHNISEAMKKMGHTITAKDIKDIMSKHDTEKDGKLTYEEFKEVFK